MHEHGVCLFGSASICVCLRGTHISTKYVTKECSVNYQDRQRLTSSCYRGLSVRGLCKGWFFVCVCKCKCVYICVSVSMQCAGGH